MRRLTEALAPGAISLDARQMKSLLKKTAFKHLEAGFPHDKNLKNEMKSVIR